MKKRKVMSLFLGLGICGMLMGQGVPAAETAKYMDGTASALQYQYVSGEVEALQYQTYNMATEKIKDIAKNYKKTKPMAVVLDLDETVLNNYGSEIGDFLDGKPYRSDRWHAWVLKEKATVIPGADKFLDTANTLGMQVYYISNRSVTEQDATINNLKKLGLPHADKAHVLVKTDSSSKQARVDAVAKDNNIVMYVGDNLGDFPADFYNKLNDARKDIVEKNIDKFGTEYIILPNATYGDWDNATFGYNFKKTDAEKIQDRINALKTYNDKEAQKIK
ncbi:5'-nucleotidase (lipoprotein e(P4) family) [Clostridium saccharoperbutylacetonicum]|uniref:5'-nucleotidase, lipoprotein e(P4) family n=1 Tax=Clostridium saccharoperbutylacetonicum N1-4(HMT) TaxID=931276 RepID=M1MV79_9CLOT|nr:5'-nucleotidase, lipoprotein e(P4) family [Clostridium saccharoperbutylacetonicum]AGF55422.1 5'-nucleotidase, lipoprotein e(P4) family [Clostridium saccharoperbutylacetonicum N1-4(HMT)]NRT63864.1 5'-nucleotidase (lipoprotein e(P4) family) [Clostridium saccharoperbutylacetonicum]NSB27228.1 5'-nucleotidase (lipoprotein e(P4) family) [Clostridium saccharoperbutylacetonicum]NSB40716.1 5'-nucleotidase (lipoprotein e(P4) family) [Clostridium saccharoperbutylacetonicum]